MYYQAFPSFSEELDFAVVGVLSELLAVGHKAPAREQRAPPVPAICTEAKLLIVQSEH